MDLSCSCLCCEPPERTPQRNLISQHSCTSGLGSARSVATLSFDGVANLIIGDADSDGDLDFLAPASGGDVVYLNNGSGRFTLT